MVYSSTIQERTKQFAIRVVSAYTEIIKINHFNDAARKAKLSQSSDDDLRECAAFLPNNFCVQALLSALI